MEQIHHFGIDAGNARAVFLVQILQHDSCDRRDIFFVFRVAAELRSGNTQPVVKFSRKMRSDFLAGGAGCGVQAISCCRQTPHSQVLDQRSSFGCMDCGISPISSSSKVRREPAQSSRPNAPWLP